MIRRLKAVLLFTSGTESIRKEFLLRIRIFYPISVLPLKISNFTAMMYFLAILPPFHSFGFTVSSLLGVLSGFRTAFYPNPTDGKGLASAFERWQATIITGAPTFIKGMFKAAKPGQLDHIRLCVTGAEKAPPDLFAQVEKLGGGRYLLEGYGITQCSPALTFNRPGKPSKGVGQPLNNVDLIIVNPETLEILPKETQGLILARGPNVFAGYMPILDSLRLLLTVQGKEWYKPEAIADANNYLNLLRRTHL